MLKRFAGMVQSSGQWDKLEYIIAIHPPRTKASGSFSSIGQILWFKNAWRPWSKIVQAFVTYTWQSYRLTLRIGVGTWMILVTIWRPLWVKSSKSSAFIIDPSQVDIALTLDFTKPEHYTHGSALLSKLQHLQDKVLQVSARLKATKTTLSTLKEVNDSSFAPASDKQDVESFGGEIKIYETQVTGHLVSLELLQKRSQETLKMVSRLHNWGFTNFSIIGLQLGVALSLRIQATALGINNNMLSLTQDAVDDSATVRVVTVVTLVYLPASFVAVRSALKFNSAAERRI